jgi:hypothetical protein
MEENSRNAGENILSPPPRPKAPVHVFNIPVSISGDIRSLGIKELTGEEEIMAERRARGDRGRIAVELTKAALVEVNGSPVTQGDASADMAWTKMSPKVRTLAITAYTRLHIPDDEETAGFFSSMEIRV